MRTIRENLIVELEEVKDKLDGGIIVRAGNKDHRRSDIGSIIAMSPAVMSKNTIKVGERIAFGKYSGVNVALEGKRYLWMTYNEILLVLDDDEDIEITTTHDLEGERMAWERYSEKILSGNKLGQV